MISMYTHQCCSRSTLDIAGTLLALSYIFCVYRLGCWENPPSPATGGGETIWLGEGGGCGGPCSYIYIYNYTQLWSASPSFRIVWTVTYEVKEHFSQVTQEQERGRFFCALMVHVLLNMVGKVMVSCTLWWFKIATMYLAILHIL